MILSIARELPRSAAPNMFQPSGNQQFGITHPLGLPRPIDPENFFGVKLLFFARNQMPIPTGCLADFDGAVYRPYVQSIVAHLNRLEKVWSGPVVIDGPARYCLLRHGVPASVPADLRPLMPEPPRVKFAEVLRHFDLRHAAAAPMQLLDVLTLVSEDLGRQKFALAIASHPWVAEFMR
jgi:hypothetical protein